MYILGVNAFHGDSSACLLQDGVVINATEALVAIDVNSGKNTFQRNIESTALNTNLEAANEIARQIRLRDLGGLIVIDFIDMDDYRNNYKVERALKTSLNYDRARIQTGRISMFGLLELSRQRLRSSLIELSFQKCHYCNGSGLILNPNSICEQILKVVKEKLSNNENRKIEVRCNTALADILLNSKRDEIDKLEKKYNSQISFILDDNFSLHQPDISLSKEVKDNVIEMKENKTKKKEKKEKTKYVSKKKSKIDSKSTNEKSDKIKNFDAKKSKTGWWVK